MSSPAGAPAVNPLAFLTQCLSSLLFLDSGQMWLVKEILAARFRNFNFLQCLCFWSEGGVPRTEAWVHAPGPVWSPEQIWVLCGVVVGTQSRGWKEC